MKKILIAAWLSSVPWLLAAAVADVPSEPVTKADSGPLAAARALYDAKKFSEAETVLKKLAASDSGNAEIFFYLGEIAGERDDFEQAAKYFEKSVQLAPQNAKYHHQLGSAYGQAAQKAGLLSKFGLAKKCLASYQRAAQLEPADVGFHQSLFEYYRQAPGVVGGGSDKAEAEAALIVKLDPVPGHIAYATLYAADKKFDQALPHLAEVKKLDASRGRLAYASLYVETKQYDKAFAEFDEVLKTTPDDYSALYQVGKFAAVTGQNLDRGLTSLRRSLELAPGKDQPTHAAAQWRIGNILEKKNDPAAARVAYEASLKLDPKFGPAAEALKKLKG